MKKIKILTIFCTSTIINNSIVNRAREACLVLKQKSSINFIRMTSLSVHPGLCLILLSIITGDIVWPKEII